MPQLDVFAYLSHVTFIVIIYFIFLWILIRRILPKLLLSIIIKKKFIKGIHIRLPIHKLKSDQNKKFNLKYRRIMFQLKLDI